jgi:hypothetical protein
MLYFLKAMRIEFAVEQHRFQSMCRWLGVDHVYLTENTDKSESLREELENFAPPEFLTYRQESEPHAQMKVYGHCLAEHKHKHNWMAFLDADEFLVIRERYAYFYYVHPHKPVWLCVRGVIQSNYLIYFRIVKGTTIVLH